MFRKSVAARSKSRQLSIWMFSLRSTSRITLEACRPSTPFGRLSGDIGGSRPQGAPRRTGAPKPRPARHPVQGHCTSPYVHYVTLLPQHPKGLGPRRRFLRRVAGPCRIDAPLVLAHVGGGCDADYVAGQHVAIQPEAFGRGFAAEMYQLQFEDNDGPTLPAVFYGRGGEGKEGP